MKKKIVRKKKKPKTALFLSMEGVVKIEELDGEDNVVSSSEIDAKTVLEVLLRAITDGISLMEQKYKTKRL